MVAAKTKTEDPTAEETLDIPALLQRIETFLKENQAPPVPTTHLTEEVRAALSAPLDQKFLRQRKGPGGKVFTYADLDYLERRAGEVDPDWGAPAGLSMFVVTDTAIVCNVTIHSVPRSATAGYYVPDQYEVWDNNKKAMVPRQMDAQTAHTIVTRAQAAAERRVFAMFGLGAELWAKNQEDAESFIPGSEGAPASGGKTQFRTSGGGEFRAPSEKRVDLLVGMGVPADVASAINSWSRGKDSKGNPISDVSETITALFAARGNDKGPVARRVWEKVINEHAPYALSSAGDTDEDDWDRD